jgi:hypothetical protein
MKLRLLSLEDKTQALHGHSELAIDNWEFPLGYSEGMPWSGLQIDGK